jgi:multidrug efflux pump subunit AcrA (membrane-fusion protein)
MTRAAWIVSFVIAPCAMAVADASQGRPATVETAAVVARVLEKTVTIPGDLTPYQHVDLNARVSGFVESLAVDRGSRVKRGQRLAAIAAPELRAQHAEARLQAVRAQTAEAEARHVAAQSTYERLKAASATPGVVAGHDLEIAERNAEASRAHVDALKQNVEAAPEASAPSPTWKAIWRCELRSTGSSPDDTSTRAASSAPRPSRC